MKIIQSFLTRALWARNTPGAISAQDVAPVFELSPISRTYARRQWSYQSAAYAGQTLEVFTSTDSDTRSDFEVTGGIVAESMEVVDRVLTYLAQATPPYDTNDMRRTVQAQMNDAIEDLMVGSIDIYGAEGTAPGGVIPEWVSWTSQQAGGCDVKVWLKDASFQEQYGGFEVVSVPPLDSFDSFFTDFNAAVAVMTGRSLSEAMQRVTDKRANQPETVMRFLRLKYVNRSYPTQSQMIDWPVLIYGIAGDSLDSIKDGIATDLIENSSKTEEDWKSVLPELFERTEFIYVPRGDKRALENSTPAASVYASIHRVEEQAAFMRGVLVSDDSERISTMMEVLPFDYKALFSTVVCGKTNPANIQFLSAQFPDYIPVNTQSADFGWMSPKTRAWLTKMIEVFVVAEGATEFSSIPNTMRRVVRDGKVFVGVDLDQVTHLVATRKSVTGEA